VVFASLHEVGGIEGGFVLMNDTLRIEGSVRIRLASKYSDEAKSMRHECVCTERQEILRASDHMSGLVDYIVELRLSRLEVPDFDPLDGGVPSSASRGSC